MGGLAGGGPEAGHLGGFVTLASVHGRPYNWRLILFVPSWDSIDDVWKAAYRAFGEAGDRFAETLGMIRAPRRQELGRGQPAGGG